MEQTKRVENRTNGSSKMDVLWQLESSQISEWNDSVWNRNQCREIRRRGAARTGPSDITGWERHEGQVDKRRWWMKNGSTWKQRDNEDQNSASVDKRANIGGNTCICKIMQNQYTRRCGSVRIRPSKQHEEGLTTESKYAELCTGTIRWKQRDISKGNKSKLLVAERNKRWNLTKWRRIKKRSFVKIHPTKAWRWRDHGKKQLTIKYRDSMMEEKGFHRSKGGWGNATQLNERENKGIINIIYSIETEGTTRRDLPNERQKR